MPLFGLGAQAAPSASATPATLLELLPPDYGLVLVVAGLLVIEGLVLGSMVMKVRKRVFTSPEFQSAAKVSTERAGWGCCSGHVERKA